MPWILRPSVRDRHGNVFAFPHRLTHHGPVDPVGLFAGAANVNNAPSSDSTGSSDYGLLARFRLTDGLPRFTGQYVPTGSPAHLAFFG